MVGLVLGSFDLAVAQAIGLVEARCYFLLDGESHFECHRRHRSDEQLADGRIDLDSENALARGIAVLPAAPVAHIVGDGLTAAPGAVVDVHSAATESTNRAAL